MPGSFATFDRYINFVSQNHKKHAFGGIKSGVVLELGAGVGANFQYIPLGSEIIAVEPNEAMHERLRERAQERSIQLEIVGAPAERLPLASNSVDTVMCSLVLCTVEDPDAALQEVIRVLKPGGTFRFVEHVAAHPVSPRRWLQTSLMKPWAWLYEGCQLCRNTQSAIYRAGFNSVDMRRHRMRKSAFVPVNLAISGSAVKGLATFEDRLTLFDERF